MWYANDGYDSSIAPYVLVYSPNYNCVWMDMDWDGIDIHEQGNNESKVDEDKWHVEG